MSQAPCQFDDELVLRQLRYTGMVETVKIRKAGYSVRMSYEVCVLCVSWILQLSSIVMSWKLVGRTGANGCLAGSWSTLSFLPNLPHCATD